MPSLHNFCGKGNYLTGIVPAENIGREYQFKCVEALGRQKDTNYTE